jgi:Fe-S cluster assembly iron-binding protein IscA
MLRLSDKAVEILKEARSDVGASEDAGVRLNSVPNGRDIGKVRIEFTEQPEPGDEVFEESGLRVYLANQLVEPLSERVLDAEMTPEGPHLAFR